jgi:hypothetical protein
LWSAATSPTGSSCVISVAGADTQESVDAAARQARSMFFGAGAYGFYGFIFADHGENYDYIVT